jgi:hypothetical protein
MNKKQKVIVLTGGLGNQLFQVAAGLFATSADRLLIEGKLGRPRLNSQNRPEIDSFDFPFKLNYRSLPLRGRFSKYLTTVLFKVSSKTFSSIALQRFWLFLKSSALRFGLFLSDGVGYDPRLIANSDAKWIIGPFHCFRYLESPAVSELMQPMKPKFYPNWLRDLEEQSKTEKPIILHIRLSDYKNISELGILTNSYYRKSLDLAVKDFPNSRIWLFTDEESLALRMLENSDYESMRIINCDPSDSAANLEAMRLGHCFVLSNSTFSWWGASLAYSPNAKIFCPENWFKTKDNPKGLIPQNWIKVRNR